MQSKVKRFNKLASAAPAPESSGQGGYAVLLDGRPLRTPAKALLILPTEPLAAAIAAEWQGRGDEVDPHAMPLNPLACTAIDLVAPARAPIVAALMGLGGHRLTRHSTHEHGGLLGRRTPFWPPPLAWAALT